MTEINEDPIDLTISVDFGPEHICLSSENIKVNIKCMQRVTVKTYGFSMVRFAGESGV